MRKYLVSFIASLAVLVGLTIPASATHTDGMPTSEGHKLNSVYLTYLDRYPDPAGYAYWADLVDGGVLSIQDVIDFIVNESDEYASFNVKPDQVDYYRIPPLGKVYHSGMSDEWNRGCGDGMAKRRAGWFIGTAVIVDDYTAGWKHCGWGLLYYPIN